MPTKEGRTALMAAEDEGYEGIVKLLLGAGADFPDADKERT